MTRVLVLDSENKNALAAIRSLGRHGLTVISGSSRRLTRGSLSRFSSGRVIYPSPEDEDAFVSSIIKSAETLGIDVVLPIGDATTRAASKHKAVIAQHAAVPVADWTAMQIASSKEETVAFAMRQGVQVPRTYDDKVAVKQFPVVVKRSLGAGGVRYVNDAAELERVDSNGAVIQDFIPGEGYGFFALFDRGRERAIFMHRRIREYPVTGGASTAAESLYDETLRDLGLRLLRALDWHGVAMVEFKKDSRDSQYKLMEINPKFWGSLDLAIVSGVDFPWLTVKMALGELDEDVTDYRVGVRFRWVFDDLMHLAARPSSFTDVMRDFRESVADDVSPDDVKPAIFDAAKTVGSLVTRAATGRLRRPHGDVRLPDSDASQDDTLARLSDFLAREFAQHQPRNVLDAGCGFDSARAGFPVPIEFKNACVVGIDISSSALDRNRLLDERIVGDLQTYPLPRNAFDVVVCWDVLEHLPRPYEALENLVASTRPGGLIILGLPNVLAVKSLVAKLTPYSFHVWAAATAFGAPRNPAEGGPIPTHLRLSLRPSRLVRFFEDQGLTVEYLAIYGPGRLSRALPRRWMRIAWRVTTAVAKIVSLGRAESERSEVIAILRTEASPQ